MAAITAPERVKKQLADDDDLTDEQIDTLLARASARLKAKSQAQEVLQLANGEGSYYIPKLQIGEMAQPYTTTTKQNVAVADAARLVDEKQRKKADGIRFVSEPAAAKKLARETKKATAGALWYDMPQTQLTPQLKRDLQLLKMRNVLDPHRHYKKDGGGKMKAPEYSQVGTIVEGAQEWFNRVENRQRKRTFVEEVLAGEQETRRFRRKYGELQEKKTSGKKGFYRKLQERRRGGVKKGG